MLNGFLAYRNTNHQLCGRLLEVLSPLADRDQLVRFWCDQNLFPGDAWNGQLRLALNGADITAFLVTGALRGDNFAVDEELSAAEERADRDATIIVPIVYDPVLSEVKNGLGRYNALPRGGRSVSEIGDEAAWLDLVIKGMRRLALARLQSAVPDENISSQVQTIQSLIAAIRETLQNTALTPQRAASLSELCSIAEAALAASAINLRVSCDSVAARIRRSRNLMTSDPIIAETFAALRLALETLSDAAAALELPAMPGEEVAPIDGLLIPSSAIVRSLTELDTAVQTVATVADELQDLLAAEPAGRDSEALSAACAELKAQTVLVRSLLDDNQIDVGAVAGNASALEHTGSRIGVTTRTKEERFSHATKSAAYEIEEVTRDAGEAAREFARDVLAGHINDIVVHTPKGDVIRLPIGAKPLDFAYAIHTDLGDTCTAALINHVRQPLDTALRDGDKVQILCGDQRKADPNFVSLTVTRRARYAQIRLEREARRRVYRESGKSLAEEAAGATPLTIAAAHRLGFLSLDQAFIAVGAGELEASDLAQAESIPSPPVVEASPARLDATAIDNSRIVASIEFCQTCKPIYHDNVFGEDRAGKLYVHRHTCTGTPMSQRQRHSAQLRWRRGLHVYAETSIEIRVKHVAAQQVRPVLDQYLTYTGYVPSDGQIKEDGQTLTFTFLADDGLALNQLLHIMEQRLIYVRYARRC